MAAPIDLATALALGPVPAEADIARRVAAARAEAEVPSAATVAALTALIACIDLTTLEGSDTPARVEALCHKAAHPDPDDPSLAPVVAVCVYPSLVPTAVAATAGTPVRVASVAGAFPSGQSPLPVRLADIAAAVEAGADEIDIVLNRGAFLSGDDATAYGDVVASIEAAQGRHVKVILETGELDGPAGIHRASLLAMAAGADFIKTSTGKIAVSATPEAVVVMADAVARFRAATGRSVGIKVAGGLRAPTDALAYAAVVADTFGPGWITPDHFRLGASRLLDALVDARRAARV